MKVPSYLAALRQRDIQVWAEGDRLRCSAPPGVLSPALREELQRHKSEILEFLRSAGSLARQQRAIVPLQPHGTLPPIFAFGGHNGDVFCFRALAQHLGEDQPFFGLQPPGLDGCGTPLARVEALAAYFAAEMRAFQPKEPCVIAGFCAGGTIAFELARLLQRQGMAISLLALFGAPYPTSYRRLPRLQKRLADNFQRLARQLRAVASIWSRQGRCCLAEKLRHHKEPPAGEIGAALDSVLAQRAQVARATFAALRRYAPGHFPGRLAHFLPCKDWVGSRDHPSRWRALADHCEEYFGPDGCTTDIMLLEPHAPVFASLFKLCRDAFSRRPNGGVVEKERGVYAASAPGWPRAEGFAAARSCSQSGAA